MNRYLQQPGKARGRLIREFSRDLLTRQGRQRIAGDPRVTPTILNLASRQALDNQRRADAQRVPGRRSGRRCDCGSGLPVYRGVCPGCFLNR